ncbi:MAG: glycoside hydrolase family 20 zincin-like fold domain-containing protein [Bacteroidales bacterium]|nr:glycoside hydrolase family 20 zincin-like fold domain-containing protein [Bacteroidales bacterium]
MNEFVPVFRGKNATLEQQRAIWMLCEGFERIFGKPLKITDKEKGSIIVLRNLSTETTSKNQEKTILPVGEEGYQLNILPDKIEIIANSNAGLFYGSQTLLQLFRTSSLTGRINCMTINDMPSSKQRYLCYAWDSLHAPSFNNVKQLIQSTSHFKFNGIALLNDAASSLFSEMELFYLKKFAEQYHVDIVTDTRNFQNEQILNINLQSKIYPELQQTLQTIFSTFAEEENRITVFHNSGAPLFIDNWYSMFWTAELLWNQPKNNTPAVMKQRQSQYEKALDRQFFEVDFSLCEQLRAFDSLQIISLSEQDFWDSVTLDGVSHDPANNRFVLTRALALEERLQLFLDSAPIMHDEILYSMIFAAQRAGFIALKNLLQESLTQQSAETETVQETVELLYKNIQHLKHAHEIVWSVENDAAFPESVAQKYDRMLTELENFMYFCRKIQK